jgi:transcription initiation factor IIF auxiliary subunit
VDQEMLPLTIHFGNQFYEEKTPRGEFENINLVQSQRWLMYFTLSNNQDMTKKYVDKVVYTLPDNFKETRIEINNYPFLLSRTAYKPFIIETEIIFKQWCEIKAIKIDFLLSFTPNGKEY